MSTEMPSKIVKGLISLVKYVHRNGKWHERKKKKLEKGNIAKHDKQRAQYEVRWGGGQRNHKKDNLVVFVEMASLNKS